MRVVPPAKRKRHMQDATLINIRALKKRVTILEQEVAVLMAAVVVQGQQRRSDQRRAEGRGVRRGKR